PKRLLDWSPPVMMLAPEPPYTVVTPDQLVYVKVSVKFSEAARKIFTPTYKPGAPINSALALTPAPIWLPLKSARVELMTKWSVSKLVTVDVRKSCAPAAVKRSVSVPAP